MGSSEDAHVGRGELENMEVIPDLGDFLGSAPVLQENSDDEQAVVSAQSSEGSWLSKGLRRLSASQGGDGLTLGSITRGLVKEGLPVMREKIHQTKMYACDVTETFGEKRHQIVNKVATALDLAERTEGSRPLNTDAKDQKRWWNAACAAAHEAHNSDNDPPAPPLHAHIPATSEGEAERLARGCLEVEVLALGGACVRVDGCEAAFPICQLSLGGRFTGALRPKTPEGSPGQTVSVARFAIDEVAGCDLRLHVFDRDCPRFSMGLEWGAFCGGALIPLRVLHYRSCDGEMSFFKGIQSHTLEADLPVALLPLEAILDKSKLAPVNKAREALKPSNPDLGNVLLRLRLTLYDAVPHNLFSAEQFLGKPPEHHAATGCLESPISVITAVFIALQRFKKAMDCKPLIEDMLELRNSIPVSVLFCGMWTYATLFAPFWKLPGVLLVVMAFTSWQTSVTTQSQRQASPPRLFADDGGDKDKEEKLSFKELGKLGVKNALKMELDLIEFAKKVTWCATQIERLRFILSLRDRVLSFECARFAFAASVVLTLNLLVMVTMFGRMSAPILAWGIGCICLLPHAQQMQLATAAKRLKAKKEALLGPGTLLQRLSSLWQRIPDSIEAEHYDLFEQHVLKYRGTATSSGS